MAELNGKNYAPRPGHIPGVVVNLGGHQLVLAPFGLRLLREYQARMQELTKRDPPAEPEDYQAAQTDAITASLQRNYPEITREEVEPLLDSQNTIEAVRAILDQSGMKRVTPGEIQPGT